MADYTPEGRSIAVLAKEQYGLRERHEGELQGAEFVEFTAQTRMSGIDLAGGRQVRKGAVERGARSGSGSHGGTPPRSSARWWTASPRPAAPRWWWPSEPNGTARALGVIYLKDIVKEGIAERFAEMRKMGIRTVMITGDNPLTAKAIADESGVDDFLAEATPEDKMALIRKEQEGGKLVAMTGDGTNDAPALAQADVGVAMNTGTSAAKEAGNMVDLDSNPTKLIEIVEIGKQLLITRGALTTFSITNDVAKYFAIIPAMFASRDPRPGQAQHPAPAQPAVGDHLGDHLQRADHRRADPAGAARRPLPAVLGGVDAPQEPVDLRRRRADHPVHRDQAHRPHHPVHPRIRRLIDMNRLPSTVRQLLAALRGLLIFTVICGIIYPLVMFGIAQVAFHKQANGSLVSYHGRVVGSSLLCQEFIDAKGNPLPQYFQPRPSGAPRGDQQRLRLRPAATRRRPTSGPNNPVLVT